MSGSVGDSSFDLSLVMPCYDEEEVIHYTIPQLVTAFGEAGHRLQLVAVDNGSTDRTAEILQGMIAEGLPIVPVTIAVNEGYGNGLLTGLSHATAPWVGFIPADGQVDADDVVRLFEVLHVCAPETLGKVRRRFRMDGVVRKLISIVYNGMVWALWPRLGSIDVNGTPKILHRDVLARMQLSSRRWFLDPEILIKAHYMKVRVLEMNVFARMRSRGLSHVRAGTCWEFFRELLSYRCTGRLRDWKRSLATRREDGAKASETTTR